MTQDTRMRFIHNWQDIKDLGGDKWLTPAERLLLDACKAGEECALGDGSLPPKGPPDPSREIRANVLRYLILGGCDKAPVRGQGIQLIGANITGKFDLNFTSARGTTRLVACDFEYAIEATQSKFNHLDISKSRLKALHLKDATIKGQLKCIDAEFSAVNLHAINLQGARIESDVLLNNSRTFSRVHMLGVEIRGQLNLSHSQLASAEGDALTIQGGQISGNVFLNKIVARGRVNLMGIGIGGQLNCDDAHFCSPGKEALTLQGGKVRGHMRLKNAVFEATVSLLGATVNGQLNCISAHFCSKKRHAFLAQSLKVEQGLLWKKITVSQGMVQLGGARIGSLTDDFDSWPDSGQLGLDGFTYGRFSDCPTEAEARTKWLEKGSMLNGAFLPQPFTHLAKVLRGMGHDGDARAVLYRREQLTRLNIRARSKVAPNGDVDVALRSLWWDGVNTARSVWDGVQRWVIGYGHHPFRSLGWLIGLILMAGVFAHLAYSEGSFAPNSGPILVSQDWKDFADLPDNPAALWSANGAPGQDWETFNAGAWAADLVIPIVDLRQSDAWAPSTARGPWGRFLWWAQWLFILAGWVITALGAAALTGVIRRD